LGRIRCCSGARARVARKRVARLDDLQPGALKRIEADDLALCLARTENGQVYAVSDVCSHELSSLSDGLLEGVEVECPTHSSRFDLRTGEVTYPPAKQPIATYPVEIVDGEIYVDV